MNTDRRRWLRITFWAIGLVAVVGAVVASIVVLSLYRAALGEQRNRLVELARSQARLIEAIASFEMTRGATVESAKAVVLAHVAAAQSSYEPAARSGEVQIAERADDQIVFRTEQRRGARELPAPIPLDGVLAEPMRRALRGESGTMIGLDYAGIRVLAAHEWMGTLGLGLVAKVDLAEIQEPFRRAALWAVVPVLGAVLLGGVGLLLLGRPILRRAAEAERRYEELVETMGEGLLVQGRDGRIRYVNRRLCEMVGFRRSDLIGRPTSDLVAVESRSTFAAQFSRRSRGESGEYEVELVRSDGRRLPALIAARPLRGRGGAFDGAFGVATDISALRGAVETARREKELAQLYFDIAGTILVVLDSEGRIELINRRGVDVLGYETAGDLVGQEWFSTCIPEEERDTVRRVFGRVLAGDVGPVERVENRVLRRNGTQRTILWHNAMLRDAVGRICGTLSSGEDITELRAQAEELQEVNAVLRAIRDVNQLITREKDRGKLLAEGCRILASTGETRYAWIVEMAPNGAAVRFAHSGAEEAFGELEHAVLRGQPPECWRRALATDEVVVLGQDDPDCNSCPARGAKRDSVTVALALRHEGTLHGVLVVCSSARWAEVGEAASLFREVAGDLAFALHDLDAADARRGTEEALAVSEAQYRSLFENAVLGVYVTSSDGRILSANPALVSLLGYESFAELARRNLEKEGYHPQYPRAGFKKQLEREGRIVGLESAWACKDGSTVYVRENATAVRDAAGRVLFYEGTVEDISARRAAEAAKLEIEARSYQAQKLESIGTLASGIAHEINNPLNGVINYGQLIADRSSDAELREFARGIVEEGNRIARIVRNLLAFSRQDRESRSPARVADILSAALLLVGAALRKDGIRVDLSVSPDLPAVSCRSQQIQQVVVNLLTNARDALNAKYAEEGDRKVIRVAADATEHDGRAWIRIVVEDHGIGIPEECIRRIFDPFFTTKPRDRGTGLGLSISYGIVREHQGTLCAESVEGEFARFIIELPAADPGCDGGDAEGRR